MPDPSANFALASPNIVHETFEDEVVVVSLDSGSYYSLEGSATLCWNLALGGFSFEAIVDSLCRGSAAERALVEASVGRFLDDALEERLLVTGSSGSSGSAATNVQLSPSDSVSESHNVPFAPPALVRYDEMRQLLLIDPVHMVGDAGWPQAATSTAASEDD